MPGPRSLAGLLAWVLLSLPAAALAHATLVLGTLTFEPNPPPFGEAITVTVELADPSGLAVEDAKVTLEIDPADGDPVESAPLEESATPGTYRGEIVLPVPGAYRIVVHDRTFRQEEVTATLAAEVEEAALPPLTFVLPPTSAAGNSRSLLGWLVWLIGLPLVAAVVVTVLVLRGGRGEPDPDDDL